MCKECMIHPRGSQKSSQGKWCLNRNMKDFNRMKEEYYGTVTRNKKADGGRVGRATGLGICICKGPGEGKATHTLGTAYACMAGTHREDRRARKAGRS